MNYATEPEDWEWETKLNEAELIECIQRGIKIGVDGCVATKQHTPKPYYFEAISLYGGNVNAWRDILSGQF